MVETDTTLYGIAVGMVVMVIVLICIGLYMETVHFDDPQLKKERFKTLFAFIAIFGGLSVISAISGTLRNWQIKKLIS